jgi:hypothetical protein
MVLEMNPAGLAMIEADSADATSAGRAFRSSPNPIARPSLWNTASSACARGMALADLKRPGRLGKALPDQSITRPQIGIETVEEVSRIPIVWTEGLKKKRVRVTVEGMCPLLRGPFVNLRTTLGVNPTLRL